jgi:hypothetical protein
VVNVLADGRFADEDDGPLAGLRLARRLDMIEAARSVYRALLLDYPDTVRGVTGDDRVDALAYSVEKHLGGIG